MFLKCINNNRVLAFNTLLLSKYKNSGFGSFYSYKYNDKELQETGLFKKLFWK